MNRTVDGQGNSGALIGRPEETTTPCIGVDVLLDAGKELTVHLATYGPY